MRTVWTAELVSFQGRHFQIPPSIVDLKPRRRPPLYLAAYAPAALARVARIADGWNPAGLPIDVMASMFAMITSMAVDAGRHGDEIALIVRANISVSDGALAADRPSFVGSLSQIVDDIERCAELGAAEVILEPQFSRAAASVTSYLEFMEEVATRLASRRGVLAS
jgi:alkanesulfonate monooxygenase SsuD/methylene tetrahydromethanopterin reductase-like flavin-dependent oxidoreductase (luciferase family)